MTSLRHNYLLSQVPDSGAFSVLIRHLLDGVIHLIISLTLALEPIHEEPSTTETSHLVKEPPEELVTVAPQLGYELNKLVYSFVLVAELSVPD